MISETMPKITIQCSGIVPHYLAVFSTVPCYSITPTTLTAINNLIIVTECLPIPYTHITLLVGEKLFRVI